MSLHSLVYEPEHSLVHQSYEPRMQRHGKVNADGWGIGWYDLARSTEPARYRTTTPIWADRNFPSIAPLIDSSCALAAVRSATPPLPTEESSTPPFTSGPWLFAHNGAIEHWREGASEEIRRLVTAESASLIQGSTDSEAIFALALDKLAGGAALAEALAEVVAVVSSRFASRLNLVLTDGTSMAATAWGETLFWAERGSGCYVASEPFDEDPRWQPVPDHSLVLLEPESVPHIAPIDA